jgi:putative ABC transport system permease protein
MFKNYLKIAWRNLIRHKLYTSINVLGLSLGLCACIVIYTICSYEFSFDAFHKDRDRIYRVMGSVTENTGVRLNFGRVPLGVSQNGRTELSGLEVIAGLIPYNVRISIPDGNKPSKYFESKIGETHYLTTVIAEPQYFDIFKYKWLAGDAATALNAPFKVVLTESKAHQYFGNQPLNEIIGKQIIYGDSVSVAVSGIVKDWDKNTDLAFTDFISFLTLQSDFLKNSVNPDSWGENDMPVWTFIKLSNATMPKDMNAQMAELVKRKAGSQVKLALSLEPLSDIHFNADVIENPIRTANRPVLYGLIAIALFILLLAIMNFINLSTAQSIRRSREVGVRKALGGSRMSLVFQFLTETLTLTFCAVILAVLLVKPVLTAFDSFLPNGITFHLFHFSTIIFLSIVILVTSALAGLYPAKVLSSYLPVLCLKGVEGKKGGEQWLLRKGLIIFQFAVSLVFIIASIVVTKQLDYTRKKDPGFTSDAIIIIATPWGDSLSKLSVLAQRVKQITGVERTALQWLAPMTDNGRVIQLRFNNEDQKEIEVGQIAGNEDFIPLYQIQLLAGRNLVHADSVKEFVINESFSRLMGNKAPGDALNKILYWRDKGYPVVGVVADFHSSSFHDPISPLCIINRPDRERNLAIKMATKGKHADNIKTILSRVENVWKKIYPGGSFKYQFYDESLALLYQKDRQSAALVNTAMFIAIFISSIGLFGLALFTAEQRAKEISIRKVLGAGVANITIMLSKDFIVLVLTSLLIASPVAWYLMNKWLQSFAYRINISWWVFILAGGAAIFIALVTVSFQALKAAIVNPIKNLRPE